MSDDARLRDALARTHHEIEQTLGKVLGYPWFKDDQANFPGATEADGVCVGEHVAETIAAEAASTITRLRDENAALRDVLRRLANAAVVYNPFDNVQCDRMRALVIEARHALLR